VEILLIPTKANKVSDTGMLKKRFVYPVQRTVWTASGHRFWRNRDFVVARRTLENGDWAIEFT